MPHFCRICYSHLPNERFTGRGHRLHVCRKCQLLPKERCAAIEATQEIHDYLFRQSRISPKNLARLQILSASPDPTVAKMAAAVHAVGVAVPFKRKRFRNIQCKHRHLMGLLLDAGIPASQTVFPSLDDESDDLPEGEDGPDAPKGTDSGASDPEDDIPF